MSDHSPLIAAVRILYGWDADKIPLQSMRSGPRTTSMTFGGLAPKDRAILTIQTADIPKLIEDAKHGSLASRIGPASID